jgi:hypothetical protein
VTLSLTIEQKQLVQTVRRITQDEIKPRGLRYMDGSFPWDNVRRLAEIGVLGMAVPEEHGGLGLPVFETALVLEELAKGCYVTAMAVLGEVRRADADHRDLCAGVDARAHPAGRLHRRAHPGDLHDRAGCRHRRRELPHPRFREEITEKAKELHYL